MALEEEIIDEEAQSALTQWETYAALAVARIFLGSSDDNGFTAFALRRSQTEVRELIRRISTQVFGVGTAIASRAWRILSGRRAVQRRRTPGQVQAPPEVFITFDNALEEIIAAAVEEINREPHRAEQIYNEASTRTQSLSRTEVNREASIASEATARALGAAGVIWVAERDACVHCIGLAGMTAAFGQPFPAESRFTEKQLNWAGYNGRPPRHPNCRCRLIAWDGTDQTTEALKREAERSVARGWSLPSESNAARLRALDRLLRDGALRLPPSVVRRARRALAHGGFPQGRDFPS